MQGPDYLYFFVETDTSRSLYWENGIVKTSAIGHPVQFTPGGWKDVIIDNVRNQKYFALDRSFSIPISSVEDAAAILKWKYYKEGTESKVSLVILQQRLFYDGTEYGYYYDSFYRGDIDFSNFDHTGPTVVVNIMEAGLVRLIKARENIKYKIPLNVPEAVNIQADGVLLESTKNFLVIQPSYPHAVNGAFTTKEQLCMRDFTQEGYFFNLGFQTETGSVADQTEAYINGVDLTASDKYNARVAGPVQFFCQLKGSISRFNQATTSQRVGFDVKIEIAGGATTTLFSVNHDFGPSAATPVSFSFDLTSAPIVLNDGDRFFIWQVPNAFQNSNMWKYNDDVQFSYHVSDRNKTTYIKAHKPGYVFRKIIENIAGINQPVQCDILDQQFEKLLTSGDAIRGFDTANITTSLSDFFQSMGWQYNAGMGLVNSVLRFESKDFFIDYSDPYVMGDVRKLSIKPYKEQLYTAIKIGYTEQSYGDVNGKYEFNNTSVYTTDITSDSKELNMVGVYRADCFGVEYVRANFEGITTTDSHSDNDVFIMHVLTAPVVDSELGTYYVLDRTFNAGATGVPNIATVFNIGLSPARLLRLNGRYIRSGFYKMDNTFLHFQTTEKNESLVAGGIAENADYQIGNFGMPYYTANTLNFEAPAGQDIVDILAVNSMKAFSLSYLGIVLLGVPNKLGIKVADSEAQQHIFLSAPQNDLEQFINVFD